MRCWDCSVLFVTGLVVKLFSSTLWHGALAATLLYGGDHYSFSRRRDAAAGFRRDHRLSVLRLLLAGGQRECPDRGRGFCESAAVAMLFVFLSLEVNTFLFHYVPGLRAGGVSILWSIFALALIVAGIWKDIRAVRYVGLALFAVVACEGADFRPGTSGTALSDHRFHSPGGVGAVRLVCVPEVRSGLDGCPKEGRRPMTRTWICCVILGLAARSLAAEPAEFRFSKEVDRGAAQKECIMGLVFDSDIYAATRPGFPDLRIFSADDKEVPYVVEKVTEPRIHTVRRATGSKVVSLNERADSLDVVIQLDDKCLRPMA